MLPPATSNPRRPGRLRIRHDDAAVADATGGAEELRCRVAPLAEVLLQLHWQPPIHRIHMIHGTKHGKGGKNLKNHPNSLENEDHRVTLDKHWIG